MEGCRARGQIKIPHPAKSFVESQSGHLIPFFIEGFVPTSKRLTVALAKLDRTRDAETR
jgi:hypothetical protein